MLGLSGGMPHNSHVGTAKGSANCLSAKYLIMVCPGVPESLVNKDFPAFFCSLPPG